MNTIMQLNLCLSIVGVAMVMLTGINYNKINYTIVMLMIITINYNKIRCPTFGHLCTYIQTYNTYTYTYISVVVVVGVVEQQQQQQQCCSSLNTGRSSSVGDTLNTCCTQLGPTGKQWGGYVYIPPYKFPTLFETTLRP